MATLSSKIRKSSLIVIPSQLAISGIGLVYFIVLARYLSVEEYGVYNLIFGTLIVFSYLCNFGIASSLQRFIPEYARLGQNVRAFKTMLAAHVFRLVLSLIFLSIAYVFFGSWAGVFNIQGRSDEFLIFGIGALFLYQIEYYQVEFNALFMHGWLSMVRVLYTLLKFVVMYVLVQQGFGLVGVFSSEAISYLAGFGALTYLIVMRRRELDDGSPDPGKEDIEFKRLGRYSAYNALIGPGAILYSNSMDFFIVAAMSNPYQLGVYALAARASKMLMSLMPQTLLQSVIRPAFYHHYYSSEDNEGRLTEMFQTLVVFIAACMLPVLLVVGITAEPLITMVFGDKYADSALMFIVLIGFSSFLILELPSDLVLQAIEKAEARLYAQIFSVYNIVAAILLLPHYGVLGVAFATGSAMMMRSLFLYMMVCRYTHVRMVYAPVGKIAVNTLIVGLYVYFANSYVSTDMGLILLLLTAMILYVALTWINNFMGVREKRIANTLLKKKLFKV